MTEPSEETTQKEAPEAPTCFCLLLCDDVEVRQRMQSHNLVGIVGWIGVPEMPITIGDKMVYARVSNVYQDKELEIFFEFGDAPIWKASFTVSSKDPLEVHTVMFALPPTPLPQPGRYHLSMKYREEILATTPIKVYTPNGGKDNES